MDLSKSELRSVAEDSRASLDEQKKNIMDENIFKRLIDHDLFKEAKSIFIYVSFGGEVDTHRIIKYALEKEKEVYVPKIFSKSDGIQLLKLDDLASLAPGYYGILEPPASSERVTIADIDLIIMPGLAFDMRGGRVGYGGGFYDKLLTDNITTVNKIALAYEFQIFDRVPSDKWDEKVDIIITEENIINCIRE